MITLLFGLAAHAWTWAEVAPIAADAGSGASVSDQYQLCVRAGTLEGLLSAARDSLPAEAGGTARHIARLEGRIGQTADELCATDLPFFDDCCSIKFIAPPAAQPLYRRVRRVAKRTAALRLPDGLVLTDAALMAGISTTLERIPVRADADYWYRANGRRFRHTSWTPVCRAAGHLGAQLRVVAVERATLADTVTAIREPLEAVSGGFCRRHASAWSYTEFDAPASRLHDLTRSMLETLLPAAPR